MKIFTRDYKIKKICSPVWGEYYNGMNSCVLDIETTGLDPRISKVILVALLTETSSGVKITQFLAENHYEENKVLTAVTNFLERNSIDYLITYNGKAFDIPFINKRYEDNNYDYKIYHYNFDLYLFLKKHSLLSKKLQSLKQKSVETYFGIASNRKDTISGKESVTLFNKYSIDGNSTAEKIILTHNREDVLQLYKLIVTCSKDEFIPILNCDDFHSAIGKYGFPASSCKFTVRPSINKDYLKITGAQNYNSFSAAYFPNDKNNITAIFNKTTKSFEINLPVKQHSLEHYADLKKIGITLKDDPDVVNDFLILNHRTINLLSKELLNKY